MLYFCLGDPSYKPYVTGTPDVNEYPLDGNEDFIVLACDGLWDHVTEYVVSTTVYNLLFENAGKIYISVSVVWVA